MPTSGATPSRPFDKVRADVSAAVVHGYPAPPPPPPGRSGSTDDLSKPLSFLICLVTLCTVVGMFSLFGLLLHSNTKMYFPRFQLDSIYLSVHNTAVWDIGFSINRMVGDLDVWARFMSHDFKAGSHGSASRLTVSIKTLLPRGLATFPGGVVTLEKVVFKCNNYKTNSHRLVIMAACENVEVDISSNETAAGDMKMMGGSILCPIVFKQTYKESIR